MKSLKEQLEIRIVYYCISFTGYSTLHARITFPTKYDLCTKQCMGTYSRRLIFWIHMKLKKKQESVCVCMRVKREGETKTEIQLEGNYGKSNPSTTKLFFSDKPRCQLEFLVNNSISPSLFKLRIC